MTFPPLRGAFFADFRANIIDFLGFLVFVPAPRLMPQAVFQPEVIAIVEQNAFDPGPVGNVTGTNAAQVLILIRQALAAGVIPVMPDRAEITDGDVVGVAGNRFKEVIAVEGKVGGWFHNRLLILS